MTYVINALNVSCDLISIMHHSMWKLSKRRTEMSTSDIAHEYIFVSLPSQVERRPSAVIILHIYTMMPAEV